MPSFEPIVALTARWQTWDETANGLEHLDLRGDAGGITAYGMVIGSDGAAAFGLMYRLTIDDNWQVREAYLETSTGGQLRLTSDGHGHWTQDGFPAPEFDGCVDIDIEATPFTNTLPIRRLQLGRGEQRAIRLAYVQVPSLSVAPGQQRYTAIDPQSLFAFESLDHNFTAELPVDRHGLVQDYPGLFRRVL